MHQQWCNEKLVLSYYRVAPVVICSSSQFTCFLKRNISLCYKLLWLNSHRASLLQKLRFYVSQHAESEHVQTFSSFHYKASVWHFCSSAVSSSPFREVRSIGCLKSHAIVFLRDCHALWPLHFSH